MAKFFRVQEILLKALEDLNAEELKRFQWHLIQGVLDGKPPMARGKVEGKSLDETVTQVLQFYDDKVALDTTERALQRMGQNQLARKLELTREAALRNPAEDILPNA